MWLLVFVTAIGFSSCSDDDKQSDYSIENTKWEKTEYGTLISLQFGTNGNAKLVKTGNDEDIDLYTYELNYPNVILYPTESMMAILKATIEGNTMTVENTTVTSGNKIIYILRKQ